MAKSKPMDSECVTSGVNADQERKWRAEDALRDLAQAEKHRRDPKLMAEVEKVRKDKMKDLASIKVEVAPRTIKMPK